MNGNGDIKPGVKTTEFWLTIVSQVAGMAVMFGWVKSGDAHSLEDAVKQIVTALGVVITNGFVVYKYIHSRYLLKSGVNSNNSSPSVTVPSLDGGVK